MNLGQPWFPLSVLVRAGRMPASPYLSSWGSFSHTTSLSPPVSGFVTITHPHHPLYRQQVEVIRQRRGADPDFIVRLPDGQHAAVAMSWTDYAGVSDPPTTDRPVLLALTGLRQVV